MPTTCTPRPPTVSRRRPSVFAAEPRPTYRSAATSAPGVGTDVPFGLPVLAELPALAGVLEQLTAADEAMLDAVAGLAGLLAADTDQVAATSGVVLEQWLGIVARHTRMDRRLLLRTARLLVRLPALRGGIAAGQLSWPQLRGLTLSLRDCPDVLDPKLDRFLTELLPHLAGVDPDTIVRQVQRAVTEWTAELSPDPDEVPPARNYLHLQPRLDGTGGTVHGEYDAVGLAILDDATAPTRAQLDHPGGVAGARADNLLTRLTHTCPPDTDRRGTVDDETDRATEQGVTTAGTNPAAGPTGQPGGALPDVKLLLRCDDADLLDPTRTPVDLLTRLVGGSLRLTSTAARRLLDERGAELRTVIVDQGQVLGVGRATRVPPGWLRDATLAVHSTCTGPLCDRPARGADLDHATPWTPTRADDLPGTTEVGNLGPLCATTNRAKETAGWRARQHPDGRRTWTHPRTGLTTTTIPATWRPPPSGPP
jgi:hypothetical protein